LRDQYNQRKVARPVLPATHLSREALLNWFSNIINGSVAGFGIETPTSPYKLVLLHAPAGYGKTTLLADFDQSSDLLCCWYFLDNTDIDRITFLNLLLASIRQQIPQFGQEIDPLLQGTSSKHANDPAKLHYFEMIVDMIVAAIQTEIPDRFALFLCNYQEINELPEMNKLINYLIQKLPQQCVLVIESRTIPYLDFAPLLANQMIFGIGTEQLRFTAQQIYKLIQIQGIGSFTEAEQLTNTFDGWIAGILLGTRLSNLQPFQQSLPIPLFSYVVNEVFKSHEKAYAFLKHASILQEMNAATCASLLEISVAEAHEHLHYLEQHSLFVTHSGEPTEIIYTCTPVLRDLFMEELRHEEPERFASLHQRAAELLSSSHKYIQAIYHALEAQVNDLAARLIIESAEPMTDQGHAETLARWIDALPDATKNSYPRLLLIRANTFLRQGHDHRAIPLLDAADRAVEALARRESVPDTQRLPVLRAELAIARSRVLFQQREYQQSLLVSQQILIKLPVDEVMLRADAHMRLGLCNILLGNFNAGIVQIQKSLQLSGRHTIRHQTADGHSMLANAYSLLGSFALAEHHITRARSCWDQLHDIWGKIDNLIRLGALKVRQGRFDEAETILQEALTLARGTAHFQRGQAYALGCLGTLYQRQERYERALEVTEESLALARQINDEFLINDSLCDLAMIYLRMEDLATATLLISEVEIQNTSGDSVGYKSVTRDLIYGTIYLHQRQYAQAWPYLSKSEKTLSKIGLKQEHLQALLRLADYYLAHDQIAEVVVCTETAVSIAAISEGYEQLMHIELNHLPELYQAIKLQPELVQLRAFLHLDPLPHSLSLPELPGVVQAPPTLAQAPLPLLPEVLPMRLPKLTIMALGEPSIYLQKELITRWRMPRAMELCFYLLDCARPMRKEQIITALWPDADEQTTRTFYSTIHYLRQALGGESIIVARGGSYALKLDALYANEVSYDIAAFEDYQDRAKQALNDEQSAEARKYYLMMVTLYRGDYVQSFYSDWCTGRRDELRNAYMEARQQLALIAWQAEQIDECINHWQHMLAIDNWMEEAHYGLMRCYARQGKRGLALRQYQRCKEILAKEFGTAPKTSIQNFYQRLMGSL
jgi:LuxR family maltose regulon positive regulatory protein